MKNQDLYDKALLCHCIYRLFDAYIDNNNNNYLLLDGSCSTVQNSFIAFISQLANDKQFFVHYANRQSKAKFFLV